MFCNKALILTVISLLVVSTLMATTNPSSSTTIQQMNQMPLSFTKNMGQWDDRVLFRANAGGATMWFTKEGVTYQFTRRIDNGNVDGRRGTLHVPAGTRSVPLQEILDSRLRGNDKEDGNDMVNGSDMERDSIEQFVLTAKFVGANLNPEVVGEREMEYKCNYFIGNEPTKWRTDVPNYEAITLKDIYPGIDLKYSGDGQPQAGQAAYEFIAAPGADIAQIRVEYEGAEETSIDAEGRVVVTTKWGDMIAAVKTPTNGVLSGTASFSQLSEMTIGFEAGGSSRAALGTLSVGLEYSTYLGGGDKDEGSGIAIDGGGNAYVAGRTNSSNFPTHDAYDASYNGGTNYGDVIVTKISSTGNSLIYSTYLGGGGEDAGTRIAVDSSGCAYVTGVTWTTDFPTLNPYQSTFQGGSTDAFVTKLSSMGNSLIYSTYLGGGGTDQAGNIAVDGVGNAYVEGLTTSDNFPTLNPYQGTYLGGGDEGTDAFVTKLSSSGNSLIYSTYLGGGDDDYALGIAVDGSGYAYVTGWTESSNFPTLNPYQAYIKGYSDVFVAKLSISGNSLIYSTYLGGGGNDEGKDITIDKSGYAFVTGFTTSSNFPTLNPYQTDQGGGGDVFVTKLSSTGNSLIYSTYLGGGSIDGGNAIAVDGSGCACVTGGTGSSNFPSQNPLQSTYGGSNFDAFVTKLSSTGNSLIYSTYLGGENDDLGIGVAVDVSGNAYVTGYTNSTTFPTLNPYQGTYGGGIYDVFVTQLHFDASPCVGSQVLFCDDFDNGLNPLWTQTGDCTWEVTGGEVRASLTGYEIGCWLIAQNTTWTDYTFEYDVRGNAGVDKTVFFRNPPGNEIGGYGFAIQSDWITGDVAILCIPGQGCTQIVNFPSQNGVWYHVQITCQENHIVIKVDGATVIDYVDVSNSCPSGGITLCCWTGAPAVCDLSFDNVVVKSIWPSGDANGDGGVDISDAVYLIAYIFSGGPTPVPLLAGDANCDGHINIADVVYLINYIFSGGAAPCAGSK